MQIRVSRDDLYETISAHVSTRYPENWETRFPVFQQAIIPAHQIPSAPELQKNRTPHRWHPILPGP